MASGKAGAVHSLFFVISSVRFNIKPYSDQTRTISFSYDGRETLKRLKEILQIGVTAFYYKKITKFGLGCDKSWRHSRMFTLNVASSRFRSNLPTPGRACGR
jgi:hypothetical protein